jgi:putative holliday junction resolvase
MPETSNIIALDVGEKRVGVAIAHKIARLPRPLTTLIRGKTFWDELKKLLVQESVSMIVVGMPRSLNGNETAQSAATREFIKALEEQVDMPIETVDEALTSRQAASELMARGKTFTKGDIDALAAVFILNDYLNI